MPHYALVVGDSQKDRDAEIGRYVRGGRRRQDVEKHVPQGRPVGSLHAHLEDACPDGGTNCRNCGDPAFTETCKAAGHCPACGTKHGIAPDSVVAAAGLVLQEIQPPGLDEDWNPQQRKFVKRGPPA